jgi:hypothetical protein
MAYVVEIEVDRRFGGLTRGFAEVLGRTFLCVGKVVANLIFIDGITV